MPRQCTTVGGLSAVRKLARNGPAFSHSRMSLETGAKRPAARPPFFGFEFGFEKGIGPVGKWKILLLDFHFSTGLVVAVLEMWESLFWLFPRGCGHGGKPAVGFPPCPQPRHFHRRFRFMRCASDECWQRASPWLSASPLRLPCRSAFVRGAPGLESSPLL